jgi:hypothetical protein
MAKSMNPNQKGDTCPWVLHWHKSLKEGSTFAALFRFSEATHRSLTAKDEVRDELSANRKLSPLLSGARH